jgi:hypothetical protein
MPNVVLGWCALGIADLVVAIGTGFISAPSSLQQLARDEPNSAITRYPFVLIPTFLAPISIVLHVYVIARGHRDGEHGGARRGDARRVIIFRSHVIFRESARR